MMRKNTTPKNRILVLFAAILALTFSSTAFGAANFAIINVDGAGEGFNDPTPVAPVGGNTGTTRGQQRLIAFQYAASLWAAEIDSPVTIVIQASFDPLPPNVLGAAGARYIVRDFGSVGLFPGAEFPATFYFASLANKRAGADLVPSLHDINAQFSSNFNFYLGLDNNHGAQLDLVAVLLHEFGHGLNFANAVNEANGANSGIDASNPNGFTDIFARHTLDGMVGLTWDQMTAAQRAASATRLGRVVWDGAEVTAAAPSVLSFGNPEVRLLTPASIAGSYQFGTAQFGPPIGSPNVSGSVVAAVDVVEPATVGPPPTAAGTTTDGCSPFTNAAAVAGNIALIERGLCGFSQKAKNATDAGAIGVIIYNNAGANANLGPPGMATDPIFGPQVTIPTVSMTRPDGLTILAQPVTASIGIDPTTLAGADQLGRVRLFMPFPVSGGSSGSHWDSTARRNLLMEPAINADLTHKLKAPDDLTLELLRDVGWFPDADNDGAPDDTDCEPNSNFAPTVVIGSCDSGVTNFFFTSGCTFADLINHIAESSSNHGQFVAQVNQLLNQLKKQGTITAAEKDILSSCAAGAAIP